MIDEKEIIDLKAIAEKFNYFFFIIIGPKLVSKTPLANTYFEQYVKYEVPNLERK